MRTSSAFAERRVIVVHTESHIVKSRRVEPVIDESSARPRRGTDDRARRLAVSANCKSLLVETNAARGARARFVTPEEVMQRDRVHGAAFAAAEGSGE